METLALYLLKSAALLTAFLAAYHVFLKRETFFKSNRWYLLAGLATSLLLPLVTFRRVVYVESKPVPLPDPVALNAEMANLPAMRDVAENTVYVAADPGAAIDWLFVAATVYALVCAALAVKFARDFVALRRLLKGRTIERRSGYKFVDVPENVAPFSYFSYIVYNSAMFSHDELINIIEHEKVHSIQKHTLDVLFSRVVCIVFWWNPVVWLYKKAILQNLEFIADSEAAKRIPDIRAYQFTLLKITAHQTCVSITNQFFQSLIKKRIVMLNKTQSSRWNSYKYLLIVPALAAFVLYFQVKVVAQEKHSDTLFVNGMQHGVEIVVDKHTSDAELRQHTEDLKKNHGIKLRFSKVKRNASGEIVCIKAEFKDENGKKGSTMINGDKAIEPIRFYKTGNNVGFGHDRARFVRHMNLNRNSEPHRFAISVGDAEGDNFDESFEIDGDSSGDHHVVVKSIRKGKQKVIVDGKVVSEVDIDTEAGDEMEPVEIRTIKSGPNGSAIVVSGETVFTSDDIEKWAEFGLAEADRAMAKADLEAARADMKRAMADFKRHRKDFPQNRRRSSEEQREEMEQMRADLDQAKAEIERARAEIQKMHEDIEKQHAKLKKSKK